MIYAILKAITDHINKTHKHKKATQNITYKHIIITTYHPTNKNKRNREATIFLENSKFIIYPPHISTEYCDPQMFEKLDTVLKTIT